MITIDSLAASARLDALGWQQAHDYSHAPMRVVAVHRKSCILWGEVGERNGKVSGRLRGRLRSFELPTVGDWVDFEERGEADVGIIHEVLPRHTSLVRKVSAGRAKTLQTLSANVDLTLCLMPMTRPLDEELIARYVTFATGAGCEAAIIFTYLDQNADASAKYASGCRKVAPDVAVYAVDARQTSAREQLAPLLTAGRTLVLIGASGVGKSTLSNSIAGDEEQQTGATKATTGAGRHTTVSRRLILCPPVIIIDTPGLRNLNISGASPDFRQAFADLIELETRCKFRDCRHQQEPDCAVQAALASGELAAERWQIFRKLVAEYGADAG